MAVRSNNDGGTERKRNKRPRLRRKDAFKVNRTHEQMMLVMRRYGRVRVVDLAAACQITDRAARYAVTALHKEGLVSVVDPGAIIGVGRLPSLINLTHAGNTVLGDLVDLTGWPPFHKPAKVVWSRHTPHKLRLIECMIAAQRDIKRTRPGFRLQEMRVEFRGDPVYSCYATTDMLPEHSGMIRFDAVITVSNGGHSLAYLFEVERTSKTITSDLPWEQPGTLQAKIENHWRYIASFSAAARWRVNTDLPVSLFVVADRKRLRTVMERLVWGALKPIHIGGGRYAQPADVFRFAALGDVTDRSKDAPGFYGPWWLIPGERQPIELLRPISHEGDRDAA